MHILASSKKNPYLYIFSISCLSILSSIQTDETRLWFECDLYTWWSNFEFPFFSREMLLRGYIYVSSGERRYRNEAETIWEAGIHATGELEWPYGEGLALQKIKIARARAAAMALQYWQLASDLLQAARSSAREEGGERIERIAAEERVRPAM